MSPSSTKIPVSAPEPEAIVQGRPQARLQTFRESLNRVSALSHRLPDLPPLFPFRLGEGPRDWALPYAFDDRIGALGATAIEDLFTLLGERKQADKGPPQRYGLRRGLQPWGLRLAASASEIDPLLDPALIEAWCDKSAGSLGDELTGAFGRAFEAELLADGSPPYGMLVAVVAPTWVEALKGRVKSRSVRGLAYERLEKALGLAFFALIELSAQRAMREVERRPQPRDTQPILERVRLSLNPLLYCSIRSRALQNGLNPWWLTDEVNELWAARRAEELLSRPIDQLTEQALEQLLPGVEARATHARCGRRARIRYEILRLLWELDRGADELYADLRLALSQEDKLTELTANARGLFQKLHQAGLAEKLVVPLRGLLVNSSSDIDDLQTALGGQIAFGIDKLIADHLDRLARALRDARAEGGNLPELYEQGRLYRISSDSKPILHTAQRRQSGHLFVDLKGFTQRTVRAKEIVVADFLRREFYAPILSAAGNLNPTGGDQLRLLNLVGDAAAFAGDVQLLVRLAVEIRRLCNAYQKTLAGVDPGAAAGEEERVRREIQTRLAIEEEPLALEMSMLQGEVSRKEAMTAEERELEISRQLQLRASELARAHLAVRERLATANAAERALLESEMLRLSAAQESLAETSRSTLERLPPAPAEARDQAILTLLTARERSRLDELGRAVRQAREQASRDVAQRRRLQRTAQGGGLEAGVFISHGAAPEEIRITDPVFGEVKVAVAEKLNEAARGTGRSSKVAEEVADNLRLAMARTGNPQLREPFAVHVGGHGAGGEAATEIFNAGEALSADALQVFLQSSATARYHFERMVRRAELNPEIVDQLSLPERLRLIVSLEVDGPLTNALLFRSVGFVVFRGFEESEGCDVYELLSGEHRLTRLLAHHHLTQWAAEVKANPKLLITGLPGR